MKKLIAIPLFAMLAFISCDDQKNTDASSGTSTETSTTAAGQSGVKDDASAKDVVKVAMSSPDHSTLVAAVKQAELVDVLSNAGPFTVFAPVNAAFDKLPAGTVDDLMKPENKAKLRDILEYHVYVGNLTTSILQDGQTFNQVNGGNITVNIKDGKTTINNSATIVTTIPASNGTIHVIDGVLLPPAK